jgi:hypothetical protein
MPAKSVAELVLASPGLRTPRHLLGEQFRVTHGLPILSYDPRQYLDPMREHLICKGNLDPSATRPIGRDDTSE